MKIVISIGGSVLVPDGMDAGYVKEFAGFIKELSKKHEGSIVTGGGRLARNYIEAARKFGASETSCDIIGIRATRMNASVLISAIGNSANPEPPKSFLDAKKYLGAGKIVVMGGTHPGHSTDGVAAMLAEYIGADLFINVSNVDGIYDNDPNKNPDAKLYGSISIDKVIGMISGSSLGAGKYEMVDLLAAKVIQRSGIRCIFAGKGIRNLKNVVEGKKFTGTIVDRR